MIHGRCVPPSDSQTLGLRLDNSIIHLRWLTEIPTLSRHDDLQTGPPQWDWLQMMHTWHSQRRMVATVDKHILPFEMQIGSIGKVHKDCMLLTWTLILHKEGKCLMYTWWQWHSVTQSYTKDPNTTVNLSEHSVSSYRKQCDLYPQSQRELASAPIPTSLTTNVCFNFKLIVWH